jgi:cell division protein FtsN
MPLVDNVIDKYLFEWFLEYDYLIVAGLGQFEATYSETTIHPAVHKFMPPNKKIRFDASVKEDDGIFAQYIAKIQGISTEEATQAIRNFVAQIQNDLYLNQRYVIPAFGTLVQTNEGEVLFQMSEEVNFLGESFGLPSLYTKPSATANKANTFTPIDSPIIEDNWIADKFAETEKANAFAKTETKSKTKPDRKDEVKEEVEMVDNSSRRMFTAVVIGVLSLCVVVVVLLLTDTNPLNWLGGNKNTAENRDTTQTTDTTQQTSEEDITSNESQNTSEVSEKEKNKEKNTDEHNNPPQNKEEDTKPLKNTTKVTIDAPKITYPTNDSFVRGFSYNPTTPSNLESILIKEPSSKYYVILGSFDKAENAYSFYNNLASRGINHAKIIAPGSGNNLYRISYGEYSSKSSAKEAANQFGGQHSLNYWLLVY